MARAFILSPKTSDASAITASTTVSNTAAVNVLRARPRLYWRSTNTNPYLEGNFGSAKAVNTLVQGVVNGKSGDTFRLILASSQANLTAAPLFDTNHIPVWPVGSDLSNYAKVHRVLTFDLKSSAWYRVEYNFAGNSDGFVQLSRLILGSRIEPATSIESGWSIGGEESIAETVDMGGEESPRGMGGSKRNHTVTWSNLLESERESLYTLLLERGSSKDIVLGIEGCEGQYAMSRLYIGRVKHAFSFPQVMMASDGVQRFTVSLTVSELAPIEMA